VAVAAKPAATKGEAAPKAKGKMVTKAAAN
jgi:hypothetical protein